MIYILNLFLEIFKLILRSSRKIKKLNIDKRWIKLYEGTKVYTQNETLINIENNKYTHNTIFSAHMFDIGIYIIYMVQTYTNLYIPNMTSYIIFYNSSFNILNNSVLALYKFPWFIDYLSPTNYYIHPYLNSLINRNIIKKKVRFACVYLRVGNINENFFSC